MVASNEPDNFEDRLAQLRTEGMQRGAVTGQGVHAAGGPMPRMPETPETKMGTGYYNLPLLKPPVWEWMIALYFFVGGAAGMAGMIATGPLLSHDWLLIRTAMWIAAAGAVISPILLIWDLGRPMRFINMLRVFKWQSPMSIGSWIVSSFGAAAIPGAILTQWYVVASGGGSASPVLHGFAIAAVIGTGITGLLLGTYTGALLAVTAVPAWHLHRAVLPFHFGVAGLGSAAGLLELLGFGNPALHALSWTAAGAETLVFLLMEINKHGAADRALHEGKSGWSLRAAEILEGPLALLLRAFGLNWLAAASFVIGACLSRFAWLWAGRQSAKDPAAVFGAQKMPGGTQVMHG